MADISGYHHLHYSQKSLKNYKRVIINNKLGKKSMDFTVLTGSSAVSFLESLRPHLINYQNLKQ